MCSTSGLCEHNFESVFETRDISDFCINYGPNVRGHSINAFPIYSGPADRLRNCSAVDRLPPVDSGTRIHTRAHTHTQLHVISGCTQWALCVCVCLLGAPAASSAYETVHLYALAHAHSNTRTCKSQSLSLPLLKPPSYCSERLKYIHRIFTVKHAPTSCAYVGQGPSRFWVIEDSTLHRTVIYHTSQYYSNTLPATTFGRSFGSGTSVCAMWTLTDSLALERSNDARTRRRRARLIRQCVWQRSTHRCRHSHTLSLSLSRPALR